MKKLDSFLTTWSMIKKALQGSHFDFTQGSLRQSIFILAVPMVLEMAMEGVFAIVDIFFLGQLGADAVATVGFTESILTIIYILALGMSVSITAIIARRVGEKNEKGAAAAAVQSFILSAAISLSLGVLGVLFSEQLLSVMGASSNVLKQGAVYTRIVFGGNFVIILLFVSNAVARGAGDSHTAMKALWLANAMNIVLSPCFIFGLGPFPKLGLTGAAVATTIGRGVGVCYSISQLIFGKGRLRIHRTDLRFHPRIMQTLIRLSFSGVFQNFIGMASWIVMMRIVSPFGSAVVAGYTIGVRVILFILLPAMGFSNAAATLVGQSLGAKNPGRAEKSVWMTGFYNFCFLSSLGGFFILFARPILNIYTNDPIIFESAVSAVQWMTIGLPLFAYGMVFVQAFNGSGDTVTPTWINFVAFWLFEIPSAYLLSNFFHLGPKGAYISISLSFALVSVISMLFFRRGCWKLKVI